MNTRETLILKTLQAKALQSVPDSFIDTLLSQNHEQADQITKNVCARIPIELARDMEGLGALLDLNKREIITLAIRDFLEKADQTLTEFDAWPKKED